MSEEARTDEDEAWLQKVTALNKLIRDELEAEGELVSHIAVIMDNVLDAANIPGKIDILGSKLIESFQMFVSLVRITEKLNEEIEQRLNQQTNLQQRIFALEEKQPRRNKPSYKEYTNE